MLYSLIYAIACVLLCLSAFFIGLITGQKVRDGRPIEIKTPVAMAKESAKERKLRKKEKAEADRINAILANIETFDGTGKGQKVIR